jgi:hypothetical protein
LLSKCVLCKSMKSNQNIMDRSQLWIFSMKSSTLALQRGGNRRVSPSCVFRNKLPSVEQAAVWQGHPLPDSAVVTCSGCLNVSLTNVKTEYFQVYLLQLLSHMGDNRISLQSWRWTLTSLEKASSRQSHYFFFKSMCT